MTEKSKDEFSGLDLWLKTPDHEPYFGINRQDPMIDRTVELTPEEIIEEIKHLQSEINAAIEKIKTVRLLKDGDPLIEELKAKSL